MEKYKKSLIRCAIQTTPLCILMIAVYILLNSSVAAGFLPSISKDTNDFLSGLRSGVVAGFILVAVFYIIRTIYVVHKPEKLEKMYIKNNDEREKLIKEKTGSTTCIITMYCLVFAMMIAGSFSIIVCYTLLAVTYAMIFIYAGATMYYRHKY